MHYRYFAFVMRDSGPEPVRNADGTITMWSDLIAARLEAAAMPIAVTCEIKIFDLKNPT